MYVRDYSYILPTVDCGDHKEIEGVSREDYLFNCYIDKFNIALDRPTAIIYAAGVGISQSEARDVTSINERYTGSVNYQKSTMVVREISAYMLHKWIGSMNSEHVVYATVNSNTCASSMHAIYEAEQLLKAGVVEEVVVIAEERTSFNTIRIFKEHSIPLVVGDGIAVMRFWNEEGPEVTDCKWGYRYDRNPFGVSEEGYKSVCSDNWDYVKIHGTGTGNNSAAEEWIPIDKRVEYKSQIGHTQGASALIELCMALDDDKLTGRIQCLASGLGGFYGGCVLCK